MGEIFPMYNVHRTMSSNAEFREMGPFSLKIDIKTSGTTFDLIKNASESFWKFGLLTLRPFGLCGLTENLPVQTGV